MPLPKTVAITAFKWLTPINNTERLQWPCWYLGSAYLKGLTDRLTRRATGFASSQLSLWHQFLEPNYCCSLAGLQDRTVSGRQSYLHLLVPAQLCRAEHTEGKAALSRVCVCVCIVRVHKHELYLGSPTWCRQPLCTVLVKYILSACSRMPVIGHSPQPPKGDMINNVSFKSVLACWPQGNNPGQRKLLEMQILDSVCLHSCQGPSRSGMNGTLFTCPV